MTKDPQFNGKENKQMKHYCNLPPYAVAKMGMF